MPFQPFHIRRWRRGSILVGTPDSIPDDALRRAVNVRLDRVLGTITSRPGWSLLGAVDSDAVVFVAKLYGSTDYSYAQIGSTLYRLTDAWGSPTSIGSVGATILSSANLPDGNGKIGRAHV